MHFLGFLAVYAYCSSYSWVSHANSHVFRNSAKSETVSAFNSSGSRGVGKQERREQPAAPGGLRGRSGSASQSEHGFLWCKRWSGSAALFARAPRVRRAVHHAHTQVNRLRQRPAKRRGCPPGEARRARPGKPVCAALAARKRRSGLWHWGSSPNEIGGGAVKGGVSTGLPFRFFSRTPG